MWTSHLLTKSNRLLKIDKWWIYKIGSGVFTLILFKALNSGDLKVTIDFSDLMLLAVLVLLAIDGHFINDYSDFESDKVAGKKNIFYFIPYGLAPMLITTLSFFVVVFVGFYFSINVLFFVVLQILSSILYSLKPFRTKERGSFALILTGFYERLNPYIIIVMYLLPNFFDLGFDFLLFSALYVMWSYFWECRNFINGQLEDVNNDQQSKINSLVILIGIPRAHRLKQILLIFEITLLVGWLITVFFIELNFIYFLIGVLVFQLIQVFGSRKRYIKTEIILDNCYSNIFMASFLVVISILGKINLILALIIILLFQYRIVNDTTDFIINRIRHVLIFFWKIAHGEFKNKKS